MSVSSGSCPLFFLLPLLLIFLFFLFSVFCRCCCTCYPRLLYFILFQRIFVSIWEIFDITIFFFMSIAEFRFYPLLISATARVLRLLLYEKLNGNNLCFRSHSSREHMLDYYNNNRTFCHCYMSLPKDFRCFNYIIAPGCGQERYHRLFVFSIYLHKIKLFLRKKMSQHIIDGCCGVCFFCCH